MIISYPASPSRIIVLLKIGTQWVHESTLHVFCKLCTFLRYSRWVVSGLETIRKLLGVGELLHFETELLMCVMNSLHRYQESNSEVRFGDQAISS